MFPLSLTRREGVIFEGAIKREPTPFKEVWERLEGKVPGDQPPASNIKVVFVIGRGYSNQPLLEEAKDATE